MKTATLIVLSLLLVAMAVPKSFVVEDPVGNDTGILGLSIPVQGSGVWTYRTFAGDILAVGKYTDMGNGWIIFTTEDGGHEYIWHATRIGTTRRWVVMGQHPFISPAVGTWHLSENF